MSDAASSTACLVIDLICLHEHCGNLFDILCRSAFVPVSLCCPDMFLHQNLLGSTVVFLRAYCEASVVLYRGTPKQQSCSVVVEGYITAMGSVCMSACLFVENVLVAPVSS